MIILEEGSDTEKLRFEFSSQWKKVFNDVFIINKLDSWKVNKGVYRFF